MHFGSEGKSLFRGTQMLNRKDEILYNNNLSSFGEN